MAVSNYNCSQAELYKACRFVWLLCQQYLPQFSDYKSVYMLAYVHENLALINTVEAMPDHETRRAPVKDLRKELDTEKTDSTDFFKLLKGYCATAFKDDIVLRDAMYGEAGQTYFGKVKGGSWDEVAGLLTAMVSFARNHQAVLSAKGYMPANFLTRLENKQTSFEATHTAWDTEHKGTLTGTDTKIIANNDLKNRAMVVIDDAPLALIKDKTSAQKFVWAAIVAEIRGSRPTGLGGKITDSATKAPLSIATATIASLGLTVTCDKEGRYEFASLAAGTYVIEFNCAGYKTFVVAERDVKTGVTGRLNAALEAV